MTDEQRKAIERASEEIINGLMAGGELEYLTTQLNRQDLRDKLRELVRPLVEQDKVHWKTRRALLKQIADLREQLTIADDECVQLKEGYTAVRSQMAENAKRFKAETVELKSRLSACEGALREIVDLASTLAREYSGRMEPGNIMSIANSALSGEKGKKDGR